MDMIQAQRLLKDVEEDEQYDLLMYLAEKFRCRVTREGEDITFFISGGVPTSEQLARRAAEVDREHRGYEDFDGIGPVPRSRPVAPDWYPRPDV